MIFLSAQPAETYFLWQLAVCINNLVTLGITKEKIHVLFGYDPVSGPGSACSQFIKDYGHLASFFIYPDNREQQEYRSSIRPHIIRRHYTLFADILNEENVFYHDADIIFTDKLPDFHRLLGTDSWYVSDTRAYLGSDYIQQHGATVLDDMCRIVGIDKEVVIANKEHTGGAQYLIRHTDAAFWDKVEKDSEALFSHLHLNNNRYALQWATDNHSSVEAYQPVQAWCADMWAVLWNAWLRGYQVEIDASLDFCWPHDPLEMWEKRYIFHNAGVPAHKAARQFYKGHYLQSNPYFEYFKTLDNKLCSYKYAERVNNIGKSFYKELPDVTFIITANTNNRRQHITTAVKFLRQYFNTRFLIAGIEAEQIKQEWQGAHYIEYVSNTLLRKTSTRNDLLNLAIASASTPLICVYDPDIIIPPDQIYNAILKVRYNEADICCIAGKRSQYYQPFLMNYFIATLDTEELFNYKSTKIPSDNYDYWGAGLVLKPAALSASSIFSETMDDTGDHSVKELLGRQETAGRKVCTDAAILFALSPVGM